MWLQQPAKSVLNSETPLFAKHLLGSWSHLLALIHGPSEEGTSVLFVLQNQVKAWKCLWLLPCVFLNSSLLWLHSNSLWQKQKVRMWSEAGLCADPWKEANSLQAGRHMCIWHRSIPALKAVLLQRPAVIPKFTWAFDFRDVQCRWRCYPGGSCHLSRCDTWVSDSLSNLADAALLLVICFQMEILSIRLVKCLNSKQCTCLGRSILSPVTGQFAGKCLFSRGIVKLNECQHGLLVLERASPLLWPNSRNIKDEFRQWEREGVWCDWRKLLSKRWCFVQGYYGWKPVAARKGSTV